MRLNREARVDIEWWHTYAAGWNGSAMMLAGPGTSHQVNITSDASGSWGCGAFMEEAWFMLPWSGSIKDMHIMVKELAAIAIAAAIWGQEWRGKYVLAYCDNTAAVAIVNSGSAKNGQAMQLRRCLAYLMAMNQFSVRASHIQGALNVAVDALSRNNLSRFRMCCPQAQQQGSPIPASLLDTLLLREPDWTRKDWVESWTSTLDRP